MANKEILNPIFYDEKGKILPEFKKFNWGACIFGFIWGICNKSYLTFLIFITFIPSWISVIAGLILPIWFGIKGNRWAIENQKWQNIEHFNHVQKLWGIWALVVSLIILIPIILAYTVLIIWIASNPEKANEIIMNFGVMTK